MNHVMNAHQALSKLLADAGNKGEIATQTLRIPYLELVDIITDNSFEFEDVDLELTLSLRWVSVDDKPPEDL